MGAAKSSPITQYVLTEHALYEINRRNITPDIVRNVLAKPEQRFQVRAGRDVLQSRAAMGADNKIYLVRVFVDVDRVPAEVVTAYRTSKIEKYRRAAP
ncbi:MAG: hypothetical protein HY678_03195 [Chloroflexi bacterium]|nr:hypothetical protein [Chloroflexota bacterium]